MKSLLVRRGSVRPGCVSTGCDSTGYVRTGYAHAGRVRAGLVIIAGFLVSTCTDASPTNEDARVVTAVEVTPPTATLDVLGGSMRLVARATNAVGDPVGGVSYSWASSDLLVARVDDDGNVEAVGNGVADITATASGVSGGARITVEQAFFQLVFDPGPSDALIGGSLGPVSVRAEDAGGSAMRDASGTVTLTTTPGSPGSLVGGPVETLMSAGQASFGDLRVSGMGEGYRLEATWDGQTGVSHPFDVVTAFDAVALANLSAGGGEVGLLVDGLRAGEPLNDYAVTTSTSLAEVGVVRPSGAGGNDEIVVFAPDRRTAVVSNVPWTSDVDTIDVTLEAPIELDLVVWIVEGPFVQQAERARSSVAETRRIWSDEVVGIVIDSVEVIDATGDEDASKYNAVTLCNSKNDLETEIGFQQGKINIYYVGTVDSGTDRGRACPIGGVHIVMAERAGFELLSHEIGHLLSLVHVDGITEFFDPTNVMHSASSVRRYLTEGQIFRQQFNPNSAINGVFGLRTTESRSCARDTATDRCPAIEKRIWSDGRFGPGLTSAGGVLVAGSSTGSSGTTTTAAGGPAIGAFSGASVAELVRHWVEIECEMDDNEGLSDRVRAQGAEAVAELDAIARGPVDGSARADRRRVAALDGLVMVGGAAARRSLGDLSENGPADLRGEAARRAALLR